MLAIGVVVEVGQHGDVAAAISNFPDGAVTGWEGSVVEIISAEFCNAIDVVTGIDRDPTQRIVAIKLEERGDRLNRGVRGLGQLPDRSVGAGQLAAGGGAEKI